MLSCRSHMSGQQKNRHWHLRLPPYFVQRTADDMPMPSSRNSCHVESKLKSEEVSSVVSVRDLIRQFDAVAAANCPPTIVRTAKNRICPSHSPIGDVVSIAHNKNLNRELLMQQIRNAQGRPNPLRFCTNCNNVITCTRCNGNPFKSYLPFRNEKNNNNNRIYLIDETNGPPTRSATQPDRNVFDGLKAGASTRMVQFPGFLNPVQDLNFDAINASPTSKTKIVMGTGGIRIIVDVFYEDNGVDLVGNRIITDMPPSRILSELNEELYATVTAYGKASVK